MNPTQSPCGCAPAIELAQSPVTFDELAHTYTLPDGRQLSGVTSLLHRQMFAAKYDGIPQAVLDAAAAYGSNVHERIELHDAFGTDAADDPMLRTYERIKAENGLKTFTGEYLVSDGEHVASSIDILFNGAEPTVFHLCDVKTTSKLDRDYVSWQLSIYAYLFELQNPGLKAGRLLALWLPRPQYGEPALVEVERHGADEVRALIAADARGEKYVPLPDADPALPAALVAELTEIELAIDRLTARRKELLPEVAAAMQSAQLTSYKDSALSLTLRAASTRTSVDSTRLKAEFPDAYAACLKTSAVKESLSVSLVREAAD